MKPVTWDSGVRWDDPNLRWGTPSYLLEPGDPGYVPDPNSASYPQTSTQPKRKTKAMPKHDHVKAKDADFNAQLQTFKNNIGAYKVLLGLTDAQIASQAADADYFNQLLCCADISNNHTQQQTGWKNIIRHGGTGPVSGAPVPPTYPSAATPVPPGIEKRFRDLANLIKAHPNYNTAIGEALGIEGDHVSAPDYTSLKPELKLELSGGQSFVRWSWQGKSAFLDLLELHVDRGSGFALLAMDTTPNYLDTTPAPATPQKWTYKAIFRIGDQRIGQWSDEVSIIIGG